MKTHAPRAFHTMPFGPLEVCFDDQVLEPRPWTLAQATRARDVAADAGDGRILELCCGAGHIGLAAGVLSGRAVLQVDRSHVACDFARTNAVTSGYHNKVQVRCADLDDLELGVERFPVIIADPPYIPTGRTEEHPADPVRAIDGGRDGLNGLVQCLKVTSRYLAPDGTAVFQVRDTAQAEQVATLARHVGLAVATFRMIDGHGALVDVVAADA